MNESDGTQVLCVLYKYHHSTKLYTGKYHKFVAVCFVMSSHAVCFVMSSQHKYVAMPKATNDIFPV